MFAAAVTLERTSFAGHETFPFRFGWLKKGADGVFKDSCLFSRDDALVRLGVGKNMVRSIRHWCLATQILEEDPEVSDNRGRHLRRSAIGGALLGDGGWDPYLEDPASLWLLHWLLVSNRCRATTWHLAFTAFTDPEFTKPRLVDELLGFVDSNGCGKVAETSVSRDVDCFVRTYVPSRANSVAVLEDTLDCPLVDLRLLHGLSDHETYRFAVGPKPSLPPDVFGFACLEYFDATRSDKQTLGFDSLLYGPGSPGQAFKLDADSAVRYLEQLQQITEGALTFDDTAGLRQLYRHRTVSRHNLLNRYYNGDLCE